MHGARGERRKYCSGHTHTLACEINARATACWLGMCQSCNSTRICSLRFILSKNLQKFHSPHLVIGYLVRHSGNKKLSYRRGTARCVVSIEILPIELSYGVVCVILRLAVLVELRLVTDTYRHRETDRHRAWLVPRMHSIARQK